MSDSQILLHEIATKMTCNCKLFTPYPRKPNSCITFLITCHELVKLTLAKWSTECWWWDATQQKMTITWTEIRDVYYSQVLEEVPGTGEVKAECRQIERQNLGNMFLLGSMGGVLWGSLVSPTGVLAKGAEGKVLRMRGREDDHKNCWARHTGTDLNFGILKTAI